MLARVGPNAEGPLPWVERDYTPVSTWMDWEKGRCDLSPPPQAPPARRPRATAPGWVVIWTPPLLPHHRCDILIKTYRPGVATGWLRELPLGSAVHLSQPMQTLDVPSLALDRRRTGTIRRERTLL